MKNKLLGALETICDEDEAPEDYSFASLIKDTMEIDEVLKNDIYDVERYSSKKDSSLESIMAICDAVGKYGICRSMMEAADPNRNLVDAGLCCSYEELNENPSFDENAISLLVAVLEGLERLGQAEIENNSRPTDDELDNWYQRLGKTKKEKELDKKNAEKTAETKQKVDDWWNNRSKKNDDKEADADKEARARETEEKVKEYNRRVKERLDAHFAKKKKQNDENEAGRKAYYEARANEERRRQNSQSSSGSSSKSSSNEYDPSDDLDEMFRKMKERQRQSQDAYTKEEEEIRKKGEKEREEIHRRWSSGHREAEERLKKQQAGHEKMMKDIDAEHARKSSVSYQLKEVGKGLLVTAVLTAGILFIAIAFATFLTYIQNKLRKVSKAEHASNVSHQDILDHLEHKLSSIHSFDGEKFRSTIVDTYTKTDFQKAIHLSRLVVGAIDTETLPKLVLDISNSMHAGRLTKAMIDDIDHKAAAFVRPVATNPDAKSILGIDIVLRDGKLTTYLKFNPTVNPTKGHAGSHGWSVNDAHTAVSDAIRLLRDSEHMVAHIENAATICEHLSVWVKDHVKRDSKMPKEEQAAMKAAITTMRGIIDANHAMILNTIKVNKKIADSAERIARSAISASKA